MHATWFAFHRRNRLTAKSGADGFLIIAQIYKVRGIIRLITYIRNTKYEYTMNLHVVAYPQISQADYELIQACRKEHNSLYSIIEPHFTLVFSVPDMEAADFIGEVRKRAVGFGPIEFTFRCAIITPDVISGYYDAFLVPDEGFSKVVRLHDSLYSGLLAPHHRLDIAYTPHLSIAAAPDVYKIKKIV